MYRSISSASAFSKFRYRSLSTDMEVCILRILAVCKYWYDTIYISLAFFMQYFFKGCLLYPEQFKNTVIALKLRESHSFYGNGFINLRLLHRFHRWNSMYNVRRVHLRPVRIPADRHVRRDPVLVRSGCQRLQMEWMDSFPR